MKFERAEFQPYISLQVAPIPQSRVAKHARDDNEFEAAARKAAEHPRDEIASLLSLLRPPRWMAGRWGDDHKRGGWADAGNDAFLSFNDARLMVDARIDELGLDAELVHAYPRSHSTIAEFQAFWRLNFDEQMERFRK